MSVGRGRESVVTPSLRTGGFCDAFLLIDTEKQEATDGEEENKARYAGTLGNEDSCELTQE